MPYSSIAVFLKVANFEGQLLSCEKQSFKDSQDLKR
jgi:hypothetical protein